MILPLSACIFFLPTPHVEFFTIEPYQQEKRGQQTDIPSQLEVRRSYRISGLFSDPITDLILVYRKFRYDMTHSCSYTAYNKPHAGKVYIWLGWRDTKPSPGGFAWCGGYVAATLAPAVIIPRTSNSFSCCLSYLLPYSIAPSRAVVVLHQAFASTKYMNYVYDALYWYPCQDSRAVSCHLHVQSFRSKLCMSDDTAV